MCCYFQILNKDLYLIFFFFTKTGSESFNYMLAVVRNLMLNALWNYASKIHSFKILNKNIIKKNKKKSNFSKDWPIALASVHLCEHNDCLLINRHS